jgi:ABC-type bacteriocin/lantibiotic exporter with double-glycine peptidase domain
MWILLSVVLAPTLVVPFVPQRKDTCGAASLAMVAAYWGRPVPHDEVARTLLQPELHGIAGSGLVRFAQERGFRAVAYEGDAAHLRDFLARGRPLIVAWGMGRGRYHNVVVLGFDASGRHVIVNDPARGPGRRVAVREFEERWGRAGHWTLLVLPAGHVSDPVPTIPHEPDAP